MSEQSTQKFLLPLGLFLIIVGWFVFPTDKAQTTPSRSATMSDYTDIDVVEDIEATQLYEDSYAVVIGINEYADNSVPPLRGEDDALAIEELLLDKGYQVKTFLSEEATLDAIRAYLQEELPTILSSNDRLLIYFAGHGETIGGEKESRKQGYLVVYDTQRTENGTVDINTAFPMMEMSALLNQYSAKHKLLIADSCFSGLFMLQSRSTKRDPTINMLQVMVEEPFVGMLTAGREGDEAFEMNGHGVFTWHVLQGLKGEADRDQDGVITATDLQSYVQTRVIKDVHGISNGKKAQNPQYQSRGEGEYVFLHTDLKSTLPMKFGSVSDAEQYLLSRSVQQLTNYAETVDVDVSVPQKPFTEESVQQFQQAVFQRWEDVYGEQPHDVVSSLSVGEDETIEEERVDASPNVADGSLILDGLDQSNPLEQQILQLEEIIKKDLDKKEVEIKDKAARQWNDVDFVNLRTTSSRVAVDAVNRFLDAYSEVTVKYTEEATIPISISLTRTVSIHEVGEAQAWFNAQNDSQLGAGSNRSGLRSKMVSTLGPVQVGKALPTFGGHTLDGGYFSLRFLIGQEKTIVVSYFATWCAPCRHGLPKIEAFAQDNDNVVAVYVALGERSPAPLQKFASELNLKSPIIMDKFEVRGMRHGVVAEGQETKLPRTFILNSDGIVQSVYKGIYPDFTDPSVLEKTGTFQ